MRYSIGVTQLGEAPDRRASVAEAMTSTRHGLSASAIDSPPEYQIARIDPQHESHQRRVANPGKPYLLTKDRS